MSFRSTLLTMPLVAALAVVAACDIQQTGENNLLSFRFDAAESIVPASFSTPIAVGMDVDVLTTRATAQTTAVSVIEAESDDPSIVSVKGTAGNRIMLRALKEGSVRIAVRSVEGDDAFTVTTSTLAKVELKAPGLIVPDNPPSRAVVGGRMRLFMGLRDANDRHLAGYGAAPVTIEPRSAATILETTDVGFLDVRPGAAGALTLSPQGGQAVNIEVIALEDVTSLELRGANVANIKVGAFILTNLRGVTDAADRVVGVADLATVASDNPEICDVVAAPRFGEGAFEIKGLAEGSCRVNATLGALAVRHDFNVIP
jgi:hypothetical protein